MRLAVDLNHSMYQPDKRAKRKVIPAAIPRPGGFADKCEWMKRKQAKKAATSGPRARIARQPPFKPKEVSDDRFPVG
jgi:hypothetical protein